MLTTLFGCPGCGQVTQAQLSYTEIDTLADATPHRPTCSGCRLQMAAATSFQECCTEIVRVGVN